MHIVKSLCAVAVVMAVLAPTAAHAGTSYAGNIIAKTIRADGGYTLRSQDYAGGGRVFTSGSYQDFYAGNRYLGRGYCGGKQQCNYRASTGAGYQCWELTIKHVLNNGVNSMNRYVSAC